MSIDILGAKKFSHFYKNLGIKLNKIFQNGQQN